MLENYFIKTTAYEQHSFLKSLKRNLKEKEKKTI